MRQIFILGPKHSGKTCVGKELALLLKCNFTDLDVLIEEQTGKTSRDLYIESQELFEKAEKNALEASLLLKETNAFHIIACGGGIIDNPKAFDLLKNAKNAVSVCLVVSADTAWQRINAKGMLPPFLNTEKPGENHRNLHKRRCEEYQKLACIKINANSLSPNEIAAQITEKLQD